MAIIAPVGAIGNAGHKNGAPRIAEPRRQAAVYSTVTSMVPDLPAQVTVSVTVPGSNT